MEAWMMVRGCGLEHSPTKVMTPWVARANKRLRTFKAVYVVKHFYNLHAKLDICFVEGRYMKNQ